MSRHTKTHRDLNASTFGTSLGSMEGVDPMAGITNLVDAMLVFACGLMLALLTYWNLDLPNVQQVVERQDMTEVNDVEVTDEQLSADGISYNERGTVYEDPTTGQLYLLENGSTATSSTGTGITGGNTASGDASGGAQ